LNNRINTVASAIVLAAALIWVPPAAAQDADTLAQELAQMRAEMARMAQRINELEAQLAVNQASTGEVVATAAAAEPAAAAQPEPAKPPPVEIAWRGAPEFTSDNGWRFKPRGRVLIDAGMIDAPEATGRSDGFASNLRRARLGMEGDMPGGFGYRFEVEFAGNDVEIFDSFISYSDGGLRLTLGQHNPFQGLEELTSTNFGSTIERAAFTDAFGFERRLGVSAQVATGLVLLQGGVFGDNVTGLPGKAWSMDARAVFMPKAGSTQLHFAGSAHHGEQVGAEGTLRYRQRPLVQFTAERFIDTGAFSAVSETGYGLEAAAIAGRLHAAGEVFWQNVARIDGLADPTFFGGYAELGYFLTKDDTRPYRGGVFDRVRPAHPLGKGGLGALQINLRYDYLDLSDASILGGRQNGYQVSLIWTPSDFVRFLVNYGRLQYSGAAVPAGGDRSYGVDALGMRAQLDF
jgi:phosphate-selective porin OprO and OprP